MGLAEILEALGSLSTEDKLKVAVAVVDGVDATEANITGLVTLQNKLWDKQDEAWYVEKLESEGYKVAKEFSEEQVREFAEGVGLDIIKKEPSKLQTKEEIRAEIAAEFAAEKENEKREVEKGALKDKFVNIFPPSMKEFAEFTVDAAFDGTNYENIIEFAEGEQTPMRERIKKMAADGGPFGDLFKNYSDKKEFADENEDGAKDNIKKRIDAYNL